MARVSAFFPESGVEILDVGAMPGQELASKVDLCSC